MATKTLIPDKDALARVGRMARKALDANPKAEKIPTDKAEIYAVKEFVSAEECKKLMMMIDVVAQPSTLYDGTQREGFRTSYSGNFNPHDPFVKVLSDRIDKVLGLPSKIGETMQGQRYMSGQQFKPHHDFFHTNQAYWEGERKRGGQRSWTAMMFLNKVEAGGATGFPEVGINIEPKPGVLLCWNNALPDGTPNEDTLHAGTPVQQGVKYVITKWYRTRKWN
ncbi:prolyl hydroxylase family protein [Parerythrobacter aestuarii]|uniref:prolyl hydroxylase family protein n=1 Tax=Parerythrobacter aestuarii TaxID=3020909 RepID=UPI0024DE9348|nr:2OG-Fe(II) oxygenase [Parerythrobacter aestuarii]